jgi:hypothetical protein
MQICHPSLLKGKRQAHRVSNTWWRPGIQDAQRSRGGTSDDQRRRPTPRRRPCEIRRPAERRELRRGEEGAPPQEGRSTAPPSLPAPAAPPPPHHGRRAPPPPSRVTRPVEELCFKSRGGGRSRRGRARQGRERVGEGGGGEELDLVGATAELDAGMRMRLMVGLLVVDGRWWLRSRSACSCSAIWRSSSSSTSLSLAMAAGHQRLGSAGAGGRWRGRQIFCLVFCWRPAFFAWPSGRGKPRNAYPILTLVVGLSLTSLGIFKMS